VLTKYYADHKIGESGTTRGRTITEADLVAFAAFTGDWHALHVNSEYARSSRFGQRIAHGLLVLSVASGLIDNDPPYATALYSLQNVRFRAPTYIGDTIRVQWAVKDMADHDAGNGIVTFGLDVTKQDSVVCVRAEMLMLVAKDGEGVP